jgi:hypothetical protein
MGKKGSSKKKRDEEEEEQELGDVPVEDAEAAERAAARKQKKARKRAEPKEEEEEEEPEEEEEEEDDAATAEERAKKKLRRQREHKKVRGYRSVAAECGFGKRGVMPASGIDMHASALTSADAKRLMRFVPEVLNKSSYDKAECAARLKLSAESVPASAARETQARCEAVLRHVMNQSVLRAVERGAMRVDAATVQSVLRPYQYNMSFSAVLPPRGLIRHAQAQGVLSASAQDEANLEAEARDNKELAAAAKHLDKAEEQRKAAFRERRAQLQAERAAKQA